MARRYNKEKADKIMAYEGNNLGQQFGRAVLKSNLPLTYVAQLFGLTRNAIDLWFAGKPIKSKHHDLVHKLMDHFEDDYKEAKLPAQNLLKAKIYLQQFKAQEVVVESGVNSMPLNAPEGSPGITAEMLYDLTKGREAARDEAVSEEQ